MQTLHHKTYRKQSLYLIKAKSSRNTRPAAISSTTPLHFYTSPAFTIIELIITTAVIAILATISYVAYTSISNSAAEATMHSDLNQASKLLAIDKTRNNNTYPLTKEQANRGNGLKASGDNAF